MRPGGPLLKLCVEYGSMILLRKDPYEMDDSEMSYNRHKEKGNGAISKK